MTTTTGIIILCTITLFIGLAIGCVLGVSKISTLYDENEKLHKDKMDLYHSLAVKDKQIDLLNRDIEKLVTELDNAKNKKRKTKKVQKDPIILDDETTLDAMMENMNEVPKKTKKGRKPSTKVSR
jgi:hypothetical protein